MTTTGKKAPPHAWKAGQSGNPKGRPAGAGDVSKIRAAISERVPELLAAMMTKALGGDVGAARLLLERAVAPLKGMEQAVALQLPDGGTLTEQGRAVLSAVAGGDIAPSQGAALLGAIGALSKISETDELRTRIELLEAKHGNT
jgi:hypothetical protein